MDYDVQQVRIEDEFKVCPSCGYEDGFHTMLRREQDSLKWLFICPSCHQVFDVLDFTAEF